MEGIIRALIDEDRVHENIWNRADAVSTSPLTAFMPHSIREIQWYLLQGTIEKDPEEIISELRRQGDPFLALRSKPPKEYRMPRAAPCDSQKCTQSCPKATPNVCPGATPTSHQYVPQVGPPLPYPPGMYFPPMYPMHYPPMPPQPCQNSNPSK